METGIWMGAGTLEDGGTLAGTGLTGPGFMESWTATDFLVRPTEGLKSGTEAL